jgi:8-oxo-dGTP pyrophosphatase MutT (NUDIX family)
MTRRAPIEEWLRAYAPVDAEERTHVQRMLALIAAPGDPFARDHYAPGHFTASGFVLSPDGRALLLIHHRKLNRWLQPGGHIERSDTDVVASARRELREEVGLAQVSLESNGIFDVDVHAIPALGREPAHEHFDVRFLFRAPSFELQAGSDARAARWVALAQIDEVESDRSVTRAVEKLLGRTRTRKE